MNPETQRMIASFLPLVFVFGFFYFFVIRNEKKKQNEIQDMRNNIKVGDMVITIGGIVGTIVAVKEDLFVVQTSGEKSKFEIMKWGINSVIENKKDLKEN